LRTDSDGQRTASNPGPAKLAAPPRRAVLTIVATVLGLVLLFSFKTPDEAPDSGRSADVGPGTAAPGAALPVGPRATSRPRLSVTPPPLVRAPSPAAGDQQIDGDVIGTQFGDIQIRLLESGGRIVDVQALELPSDRRRSRDISQFSEPILQSEALQAQSAQIDTVSGATYTSEAYRESLQSALDRAHG
jgi:uncharacterized protein with FMN-binding domain